MGLVDVSSSSQLQSQKGFVILFFWADWSKPCGQLNEIFSKLSTQHPHLVFAKVEAEKVPEISEKYSIEAVPHFLFLKDGAVVDTVEGFNPPELAKKVAKYSAQVPATPAPTLAPSTVQSTTPSSDLASRLSKLTNSAPVMLFMKGTPETPQCGFSSKIVNILKEKGIQFSSFNILSDQEVRDGLKKFSNWPTYPQLYVEGKLIGGLDIVKELAEQGELDEILPKPKASLTERIQSLLKKEPVMLFMKGEPKAPRCGFSRQVVDILNEQGAKFGTFDILSDEEIRQGLKTYSNWPTYPQLYVNGKLIGGLDIIKELKDQGELQDVLLETN